MDPLFIHFFKGLFNENGAVSSKRVVGFLAFVLMAVMAVGEQFFKFPINMAVFGIIFSLVLACFSLNAALQAKAMSVKKDVASDIVKNTGDNESAKETMQAAEPSA